MPSPLPDCHLVRTAIPFLSHKNSLGDFHRSLSASLASFADMVSKSRGPPVAPAGSENGLASDPPYPLKAGYICTQRYGPRRPMHRIAGSSAVSYTVRKYHGGSTSVHKNRSPRKQGRGNHAIGNRPESASAKARFPPAPTHNWAYQEGTRGFIDVPFRGFLGPP